MTAAIRLLSPDDAPAYRTLRLRALADHPDAFTSGVEQEAARPLAWSQQRLTPDDKRPHDFFLGAFRGSDLRGMVGVEGRYRPKERHNARVVGMYVAPALAGQGVGMVLMEELLRRARSFPELLQLDLTVTAGNERAQGIYTRCGFTVCGILPDAIRVDGRFHAKVHMVLRLR